MFYEGLYRLRFLVTIEALSNMRKEKGIKNSTMGKKTSTLAKTPPSQHHRSISSPGLPPPPLPPSKADSSRLRLGFVVLIVCGIVALIVATSLSAGWFHRLSAIFNPQATPTTITTLGIQRTAPYAGLDYTLVNAQVASSFPDDPIHAGVAVVRLNLTVANHTTGSASVLYYDAARLIVPKLAPIAPTNVTLSANPAPGTSQSGWLDFSTSQPVQLAALKMQLGSMSQGESLVTIPFTGSFNPAQYADRTVHQSLTVDYYFPYYAPRLLYYHLTAVEVRYDYNGRQVQAGQQFYVLDFQIDNPNGSTISPGYGYDYIRLVIGGSPRPPVDSTLPYGFKSNVQHVSGRVAFSAPAGLHSLTIEFLVQYGNGGSYTTVQI